PGARPGARQSKGRYRRAEGIDRRAGVGAARQPARRLPILKGAQSRPGHLPAPGERRPAGGPRSGTEGRRGSRRRLQPGEMTLSLFALQLLNGIEVGLLLFLVASGLTLVFGVLGVLNFAHGSFYMLGAYLAWWLAERTGSLLLAILVAIPAMVLIGLAVERLAIARLYARDHLSQVLLTYGLVLLFNELQRALWGNDVHGVSTPRALAWTMPLGETQTWPAWRAFTALACVGIGVAMRQIVLKTRFGMRVRAGASNAEMV